VSTIEPTTLLIVTELLGSHVGEQGEAVTVSIAAGTQVTALIPTEPERRQLGIAKGVPILVITEPDGEVRKLPADRTIIEVSKERLRRGPLGIVTQGVNHICGYP
jgi:hypothetical protein